MAWPLQCPSQPCISTALFLVLLDLCYSRNVPSFQVTPRAHERKHQRPAHHHPTKRNMARPLRVPLMEPRLHRRTHINQAAKRGQKHMILVIFRCPANGDRHAAATTTAGSISVTAASNSLQALVLVMETSLP